MLQIRKKSKLDFKTFDSLCAGTCIYGQMTDDCSSIRAKELMDLACIRVMNLKNGVGDIENLDIEDERFVVNGEYKGQTWKSIGSINLYKREYSHLSALEAYIATRNANNEDIIKYLKGEINTLIL
jgi:hypothetical protein